MPSVPKHHRSPWRAAGRPGQRQWVPLTRSPYTHNTARPLHRPPREHSTTSTLKTGDKTDHARETTNHRGKGLLGDSGRRTLARRERRRVESDEKKGGKVGFKQYRITFYKSAETRVDPFELAWLLAKHGIEVIAKNERPMLFVMCSLKHLKEFADEVNREFGPLIFKAIEEPTTYWDGGFGYTDVDFDI